MLCRPIHVHYAFLSFCYHFTYDVFVHRSTSSIEHPLNIYSFLHTSRQLRSLGVAIYTQSLTIKSMASQEQTAAMPPLFHRISSNLQAQIGTTEWQPSMTYRQLGSTGLRVSSLALGSWITFSFQFGEDKAKEIMGAAFDAGINFFDTAEAYADGDAETIMGKAIQWGIAQGKWRRSDLVIATKVFWGKQDGGKIKSVNDVGLSRKHVIEGVSERKKPKKTNPPKKTKRKTTETATNQNNNKPDLDKPCSPRHSSTAHAEATPALLCCSSFVWPRKLLVQRGTLQSTRLYSSSCCCCCHKYCSQ